MLLISLIFIVGDPFSCFDLVDVSFYSQEIYLKQRSPAGSDKKNNALAVYELIIIKVKNHHIPATILVDITL